MDKLTIAITGAHGFIAQHLASRFIEEGHNVAAVPRDILLDPELLTTYFDKLQPHYIFHFAAYGNMATQKEEDEIFATNIVKTYMLLQATKSLPYLGFINVSSSSIYGTKHSPMHERDIPDTDTLYGATKLGAEYLCRYFAKHYDKPIVTVRPFSVIGIGEQEEHLIPTLIRHAYSGKKMKFVSEPTHDFIDVEDVIEALLTLSLHAKEYKGQAFNIGTGIYWTNEQVKEAVEQATGKKIKTTKVEALREYDSTKWVADPTKLKMLGWFPQLSLEDTIAQMVAYEETRTKNTGN